MGALVTVLKRSAGSFGSDRCTTLSAAIAYRTVFALLPLALLGVSVLGFFMDDAEARSRVIQAINSIVALGPEGDDALLSMLEGTARARGIIGLIGLLTAAWSASALFGEIRMALNAVWDVDRNRPMLRAKAQDLLLLFGFGGLLVASTASTGVLRGAREAGARWIGPLTELTAPIFNLLVFVAPLALTFLAFLALYRFAPHIRVSWRDVWPAAVIAALFFEFGKNLLSYYITNIGNFNALAGTLGAVILILVFVYYATQVVLFAAEITKHSLLIRSGALPAADPKVEKPDLSTTDKVKGMAIGLWKSPEPHHASQLPYDPGRMDPSTDRPTNTVEEVMVKWDETRRKAEQAAGGPSASTNGIGRTGLSNPSVSVIAGEARRLGERLFVESEGKSTPIHAVSEDQITRNGKAAELADVRAGDWLSLTVAHDGSVLKLDATDRFKAKSPATPGNQAVDAWLKAAGFLVSLGLGLYLRLRGGNSDRDDRRRSKRGKTILRREPTD
jgi:membrane protein